jgi:hypothetical protein
VQRPLEPAPAHREVNQRLKRDRLPSATTLYHFDIVRLSAGAQHRRLPAEPPAPRRNPAKPAIEWRTEGEWLGCRRATSPVDPDLATPTRHSPPRVLVRCAARRGAASAHMVSSSGNARFATPEHAGAFFGVGSVQPYRHTAFPWLLRHRSWPILAPELLPAPRTAPTTEN